MTVKELILNLISDTEPNDRLVFFDTEEKVFKDISIEKSGSTVFFNIKNRKKSDMEIREDFFK